MKTRPIHKNLDTSFVNLSALIKYLRRRQFIGSVEVQLNGYRADIKLMEDNLISVHEHDEISGRVSEGEEAFQRLLIRSRESGGTIDVSQSVTEREVAESTPASNSKQGKPAKVAIIAENGKRKNAIPVTVNEQTGVQQNIPIPDQLVSKNGAATRQRRQAVANQAAPRVAIKQGVQAPIVAAPSPVEQKSPVRPTIVKTKMPSLPDFPFKLSNQVEGRAQKTLSLKDWQTVLKLSVELLTIVDRSLAAANLNFSAEFKKICTEIADDYPFLHADSGSFSYSSGKIGMQKQISEKIFVSGITEALRKILVKLSKSQKYSEVYKMTAQRMQILIEKRAPIYGKFGISTQIRRIVSP